MEDYSALEVIFGLIIVGFALVPPLYQLVKRGKDYSPLESISAIIGILMIALIIAS